jgi:hypothetical protein
MPSHARIRPEPQPPRRSPGIGGGEPALLDEIEARFRLLAAGPKPLAVDGRRIGRGLPQRLIALPELSSILMHPSCSYPTRDAVWRLLVAQARTGEARWGVAAVGVALPGLRFKAYLLSQLSSGDVQAALVEAFLRALRTVDPDRPGVVSKLLSSAFSSARTNLRVTEPAASGEVSFAPGWRVPPPPCGHPDLVLARAVTAGVITAEEADLIGVTRLEETTLTEYAEKTGQARWNLYKRRSAAEDRLVSAIRSGQLADAWAETVVEATGTIAPEPVSRADSR